MGLQTAIGMDIEIDRPEYHWHFFTEMFSLDRTEPFIEQLGLPMEGDEFSQVKRVMRSCLEVYIYLSVLAGAKDSPHLIRSWKRYRKKEHTLDDARLAQIIEELHLTEVPTRNRFSIEDAYKYFQGSIPSEMADALETWLVRTFVPSTQWLWEWTAALNKLLSTDGTEATLQPPLSDKEKELVERFYNDWLVMDIALQKRFFELIDSARRDGPSLWEAVLQSWPADSKPGADFLWISSIKDVVILWEFRRQWGALREELGTEKEAPFRQWVREHAPNKKYLPNDMIFEAIS